MPFLTENHLPHLFISKFYLHWHKNRHTEHIDQMKQNRNSEINPRIFGQFITKKPRIYNAERMVSSIIGAGKTTQPQAKE